MRTLPIIMRSVLAYSQPKMPLAEKHESIQTFALYGKNKSLRISVQIWTARGQAHRRNAGKQEQVAKVSRENWFSVHDEEARASGLLVLQHNKFSTWVSLIAQIVSVDKSTVEIIGCLIDLLSEWWQALLPWRQ